MESAGHPAPKSGGSGWILTMFVMVAEMFGLGILTLPADFARLGWAIGLGLVLLFCMGTMYSGVLFSQLGAKVPHARVYEDFAAASLGRHGRWLVYCTVYLVIFLDPIIFHLTATQSLQQIFYQKNVPLWVAGLAVSVIMLPLSQLQDIGDVSLVSILGTLGMLTSVIIATLKLLMMEVKGPRQHEAVHSNGFNVACVALMDIVFTFGGQWIGARLLDVTLLPVMCCPNCKDDPCVITSPFLPCPALPCFSFSADLPKRPLLFTICPSAHKQLHYAMKPCSKSTRCCFG